MGKLAQGAIAWGGLSGWRLAWGIIVPGTLSWRITVRVGGGGAIVQKGIVLKPKTSLIFIIFEVTFFCRTVEENNKTFYRVL